MGLGTDKSISKTNQCDLHPESDIGLAHIFFRSFVRDSWHLHKNDTRFISNRSPGNDLSCSFRMSPTCLRAVSEPSPSRLRAVSDSSTTRLRPISDSSTTRLRPVSYPSPTRLRPVYDQSPTAHSIPPIFEYLRILDWRWSVQGFRARAKIATLSLREDV